MKIKKTGAQNLPINNEEENVLLNKIFVNPPPS